MRRLLTPDMFADWREHPVTQVVLRVLASRREERKDTWESGEILALEQTSVALRNAAAIGECQAYKFLQELTLEILEGELEDAEQERA